MSASAALRLRFLLNSGSLISHNGLIVQATLRWKS